MEEIESRITAGPITDLGLSSEVVRKGYLKYILEYVRNVGDGKYLHDFEFCLENGIYYDELFITENDSTDRLYDVTVLNKTLKENNLYMAWFSRSGFGYPNGKSNDGTIVYFFGAGDLYKDKDVPLEVKINSPRFEVPVDFDPIRN